MNLSVPANALMNEKCLSGLNELQKLSISIDSEFNTDIGISSLQKL